MQLLCSALNSRAAIVADADWRGCKLQLLPIECILTWLTRLHPILV